MKKMFRIILLCAVVAFASCGSDTQYKVTVKLTGVPDGTPVTLVPSGTHDTEEAVASLPLQNGRVVFTGEVEGPRYFAVKVEDRFNAIQFFIDKGYHVTVSADVRKMERNGAEYYEFSDTVITGSPLTDMAAAKLSYRADLDKMYEEYHTKYASLSAAVSEARSLQDEKRLAELYASDEYKAFSAAEHNFFETVKSKIKEAILSDADTWWGPFVMLQSYSYFTHNEKELFDQFSDAAKQSYYGQKIKDELYPESYLGKPVPEFTVTSPDGAATYTLPELLNGKRYVLIDFWASWCAPCRKEIPNLKRIYGQFAGKGFEIVSISTDKEDADWRKALSDEQMPWPNFRDTDGSIAKAYGVRAIPAMFLVDSERVLVIQDLRGQDLQDKLEELLK